MAIFWPETTKVYCFLKVHTKHADPRDATREDLLRACEKEDIMATPHIAESDYKHALREDCAKLKDRCDKAEALLTRFLGLYRGPMGVVVDDIRAHLAEVGK